MDLHGQSTLNEVAFFSKTCGKRSVRRPLMTSIQISSCEIEFVVLLNGTRGPEGCSLPRCFSVEMDRESIKQIHAYSKIMGTIIL